jgi:sporulation protein YhbH
MAVKELPWGLSQRGTKDVVRHQEKVKDAIRENIAGIIGEEAIITRKKDKAVKVPVRGLKSYRFIYDKGVGGTGIGQGEGKKGDVISRRAKGQKPGQAGDQPGVDYLETEIDIETLIEMMLEDLGLPNLQEKEVAQMVVPKGWTFDSVEKHGLQTRLDKKRTVKEAVRRTASFVKELTVRTDASQEECEEALYQTKGDLLAAEQLLKRSVIEISGLKRTPYLFSEDLRFRTLREDVEYYSNAVVLAMMDVSGSMGMMKKYLARSFFFWLVEFLRHIYERVEIRFIAHTTEAKLVDEHEFFHKGESGGTFCWSAYELALHLVETEYNPEKWNVYAFHFSDGEDWDPEKTASIATKLIAGGINMLGYGEIHINGYYSASRLMETLKNALTLTRASVEQIEALSADGVPFVGVIVKDKTHVWPALRTFLKQGYGGFSP